MRKYILIILLSPLVAFSQALKSPKQFLGYELGQEFTPYYKISGYFEQAAAAMPKQMQLKKYGETYEGRPLYYAVISSEENMLNLEEHRKNSLAMAGMGKGNANTSSPAVIWLSYNVHGNEASSSEVSMRALYELLSPSNPGTNTWLKNTIVIIDPCLNPDGRDRYVNWIRSTLGKNPNAAIQAREHHEPWPKGRSNHYYFDLNRDWAWQSQVETQQRVKAYNEWMPSIHVDFHEQYYNNPYYFAPAAEPLHEVITPFQRDFQMTIGKNHAKYFDAKGWLYFTKEYFDLFYPAYGDTYPIYNGAIGMTYEQAGHSMAGLAIADGQDTLTLEQRIDHHFTTTMSTLETVSANAERINSEFRKYFAEGLKNGSGVYKSYIVRGDNAGKLASLKLLFDRNGIEYGLANSKKQIKGYNYFTGKDENFTTGENDLVVSTHQPKAALVRVLFEPQSVLSDSVTYDITAWALPYVYGLQAYAVKEKVNFTNPVVNPSGSTQLPLNAYAYLVNYRSFEDGKFLAALLKHGLRVRIAENDFSFEGRTFNRGTLIILRNNNQEKLGILQSIADSNSSEVVAVSSGFMETGFDFGSDKVKQLKKPSVALITGENVSSSGAGEVWHLFDQQLDYPVTLIQTDDLESISLNEFNVLILADGTYQSLSDKEGNEALKSWISSGGKLIVMDNVVKQMAAGDWGIKLKKDDKEEDTDVYANLKKYANRERDQIADHIPGAIYKVELDNTHPLAFGYPSEYFTLKLSSNIYEFMDKGWNVGVIKKNNQVAGFVGSRLKEKLQDGTTIAVQPYGGGTIVYFADDPLFRSFWENGKLLFTNAIFLTGN